MTCYEKKGHFDQIGEGGIEINLYHDSIHDALTGEMQLVELVIKCSSTITRFDNVEKFYHSIINSMHANCFMHDQYTY